MNFQDHLQRSLKARAFPNRSTQSEQPVDAHQVAQSNKHVTIATRGTPIAQKEKTSRLAALVRTQRSSVQHRPRVALRDDALAITPFSLFEEELPTRGTKQNPNNRRFEKQPHSKNKNAKESTQASGGFRCFCAR